jgi:hypothetical protein
MTLGGLAVSYAFDLPSGPAIVLLGAAMLLLAEGRQRLQRRLAQRSEPAGETFPRAPRTTRADRDRPLS